MEMAGTLLIWLLKTIPEHKLRAHYGIARSSKICTKQTTTLKLNFIIELRCYNAVLMLY